MANWWDFMSPWMRPPLAGDPLAPPPPGPPGVPPMGALPLAPTARPNFWGPGAYEGMGPGAKSPVASLHQEIYGSPFIPSPVDRMDPGSAPKAALPEAPPTHSMMPGGVPPVPNVPPPMMGRRVPAPATMPMPGALPEGQSPPGAMGMGDLGYPGAMDFPKAPPPPAEKPGFFERNSDVFGKEGNLWPALVGMGQGLQQPSWYGTMGTLGQGLTGASNAVMQHPFRRAQLDDLRARGEERKEKAARTKAWGEFVKTQPAGSYLRKWGQFLPPEKLAEKLFDKPAPGFEFDESTGKYRLNKEWADQRIAEMRERASLRAETETALSKNVRLMMEANPGMTQADAIARLRDRGTGAQSTDRAAMEAYLKSNPGKTAFDYIKEKANFRTPQGNQSVDRAALDDYLRRNPDKGAMDYLEERSRIRQGAAKPTALMQNSRYLAQTLGIPEADAARVMSQSREQSDSSFYSTIYAKALNSPMVAGDAQRAGEIAREAVRMRKQFQSQMPGSQGAPSSPGTPNAPRKWKHSATGPNGQKVFSDDGQTWHHEDGRPYR